MKGRKRNDQKRFSKVATELNDVLGLSPEIDTKVASKELKSLILEAAGFIEPEDVISKGTLSIIKTLKKGSKNLSKMQNLMNLKMSKKRKKKKNEEEENEEDEDEDGEEDDDEDEDEEEEPEPPKKKGKRNNNCKKRNKNSKGNKENYNKKGNKENHS